MRSVDLKEFITGFVAEADDHLRRVRSQLLELDSAARAGRSHPRAARELFRSFHTIKGLASMVGVEPIAELSHAVEAVLRGAEQRAGQLSPEAVNLVIESVQVLERQLRAVSEGAAVESANRRLLERLGGVEVAPGGVVTAEPAPQLPPELEAKLTSEERAQIAQGFRQGQRVLRVEFVPKAELARSGISITSVRERLAMVADIVRVLPVSIPASEAAPGGLKFVLIVASALSAAELETQAAGLTCTIAELAAPQPPSSTPELAPLEAEVGTLQTPHVRVAIERLDGAIEQLSLLLINRHKLDHTVRQLSERGLRLDELSYVLGEQARQLKKLRAAILGLRMVPVPELLDPLPLLVRGLSSATGKAVRLELEAAHAELDKAVAERLLPALVHLVRNAVDHAIEPSEERRRLGKPADGVIRIAAAALGSSRVELSVSDDGRGIDAEAVARKAGVEVPRSDEALLDLLARPGLSTKQDVTRTSGRGLGVDIVRKIVTELGGEMSLRTSAGAGTTFTLNVPLTLTIADVFAFECAEQSFVVPVSAVDEIIDVTSELVLSPPAPRAGGVSVALLERRGTVLPLLQMGELLGIRPEPVLAPKALLVRRDTEQFAVGIDRLLGQKEVVVRPMPDPLVKVDGITGSTDLGDGRPVLVLDLLSLSRRALSPLEAA